MTAQKWFLIISLTFGLLFIFVTPPFQSPDEYNHFFRAVGISNGNLIPTRVEKLSLEKYYYNFLGSDEEASPRLIGSYLSNNLVEMVTTVSTDLPGNTSKKQDLNKLQKSNKYGMTNDVKVFVSYPNTALYSPILYLPSVVGILIAKVLQMSFLEALYYARILSLSIYILIIYFALKITPYLKTTMFLLALMPMSLFLGMSVTADSLLIASSFFAFALIGSLYNNYDKKLFIFLVIISFVLGMSKSAYLLLPFASLILSSKLPKYRFLLPIIASIAGFALWFLLSRELYVPLRIGVDPFLQLKLILNTPVEFIKIFFHTIIGNRNYIVNQFVGNLGWLDVPLNLFICWFYVGLVMFSTMLDNNRMMLKQRIIYIVIAFVTVILISILMYMSWTPLGNKEILGLVGKNFIPISIYAFSIFSFRNILNIKLQLLTYMLPIPVLVYTVSLLVERYYIFCS